MSSTSLPPDGPEIEYIYLTFWNKVAIVGGAVGFLLLASVCMICIICPSCLCHEVCFSDDQTGGQKNGKKRKIGSQRSTSSKSSKGSYGSTDSDYMYGVPEGTDTGPLRWLPLNIIKETDTDYSSDAPPAQEVIKLEPQKHCNGDTGNGHINGDGTKHQSDSVAPLEDGEIEFSLEYSPSEENLIIKVLEVRKIVMSEGTGLVSPYVKVRLYRAPRQFFTFRGASTKDHIINNLEKELKTKMQRPGEPLTYKESFSVPIGSEDLKSYTLRLLLCDMDKLSCHLILGETSKCLRKLDLTGEKVFTDTLEPPIEENLGAITLGLSYLPTSEKLYLTIDSISGLKVMDKNTGATDACVKAYLMYDGKQMKRVKTTVRAMDLNPVFNESFSFDVPQNELEKIYFSLVVCHYNIEKKGTRIIGRVYMGMNFELVSRDHWKSMMQNPRKKIVSVYKILP